MKSRTIFQRAEKITAWISFSCGLVGFTGALLALFVGTVTPPEALRQLTVNPLIFSTTVGFNPVSQVSLATDGESLALTKEIDVSHTSPTQVAQVPQNSVVPTGEATPKVLASNIESTPAPAPTPTPSIAPTAPVSPTPSPTPAGESREERALWISRFDYVGASDLTRFVDLAIASGITTIYFQVRGTADAYYRSNVEPWGARLSGTLGKDPGWDPLATVLSAAHAKGLEVHAWMNLYPMWFGTNTSPSVGIPHIYHEHPEWLATDQNGTPPAPNASYLWGSPGNPELRAHLLAVVRDLITNYAIEGVHLDFIRTAGIQFSHDQVSTARFTASGSSSFADWQRGEIAELVKEISDIAHNASPRRTLSAAVFGRYDVAKSTYYQDGKAWLTLGYLDRLVPMIYWSIDGSVSFTTELNRYLQGIDASGVIAGLAAYKYEDPNHPDYDLTELSRQIAFTREKKLAGFALFSARSLDISNGWERIQ
ncbi:MAG: family 10 glycosylhydrolase [Parcubacteria group bacterium]|nr:family 10 glycosylhydrolase [Parcubacteria group bacterium]